MEGEWIEGVAGATMACMCVCLQYVSKKKQRKKERKVLPEGACMRWCVLMNLHESVCSGEY